MFTEDTLYKMKMLMGVLSFFAITVISTLFFTMAGCPEYSNPSQFDKQCTIRILDAVGIFCIIYGFLMSSFTGFFFVLACQVKKDVNKIREEIREEIRNENINHV